MNAGRGLAVFTVIDAPVLDVATSTEISTMRVARDWRHSPTHANTTRRHQRTAGAGRKQGVVVVKISVLALVVRAEMSNPSKQKGTAFEVSLLPALHQLDGRVERSALKGTRDAGDFTRLYYLNDGGDWNTMVVSAKNCRQVNLSGWLKEAERQRQNAKADSAIVVHKKRGTTDPTAQYVTMTLGTLVKLLS